MSIEKINAAKGALRYVKDGMVIGLGSGTTAREFIYLLAERIKQGLDISAVTTSLDSRFIAKSLGIKILELDQVERIDLAVDGADVATKTSLLKGGGGALTREKIVGYAAKNFIIIADPSKLQPKLSGKLVVEVVPFAYSFALTQLKNYSKDASVRLSSEKLGPTITDNGNFLIDVPMEIKDPKKIELELNSIPGVVENGIFTKFSRLIIGQENGFKEF
ncbi:ribose-5-phosphate isomerase RpiA [Candidatus Micrarchaeota archaeon]|nr:ribose-5-phosphate isomerase RpiA [Candidatus Micrarchaeota archaeon]